MSESLEILFYNSANLNQPGTLSQFIALFESIGFNLKQFQTDEFNRAWLASDTSQTEALHLAHLNKGLEFSAYHSELQLEILQQLYWDVEDLGGKGQDYICTSTANTPYFWRPEYDPLRYSNFYLDLAERIYNLLHPGFGWVDFHTDWLTTHGDVRAVNLPMLYWATFLGPSYVVKLGREHILQAPIGRVKILGDGGILYTLSSGPGFSSDRLSDEQIQQVKAHFQVERVR